MKEPKHPALAGRTAVNSVTWDLVAAVVPNSQQQKQPKNTTNTRKKTKTNPKEKDLKKLSDIQLRKLTATVRAEGYEWSQYLPIFYVYKNRIEHDGFEAGLTASSAYKNKSDMYKMAMVALGDPDPKKKYKSHKVNGMPIEKYLFDHGKPITATEVNNLHKTLEKEIQSGNPNPYPGWLGQGSLQDLNLNTGLKKHEKWPQARQYLHLFQKGEKVNGKELEKLVVELPASKVDFFSYIFDEVRIKQFFKAHRELLLQPVIPYRPQLK